jgi:hypothetical protein
LCRLSSNNWSHWLQKNVHLPWKSSRKSLQLSD